MFPHLFFFLSIKRIQLLKVTILLSKVYSQYHVNTRTRIVLLRMVSLKKNRLVRCDVSSDDTEVGTEEMAHWEMIAAMIHQCMKGASMEELTAAGLDGYYILHNHGVFPGDPNGVPFTSAYIQCTGDPIADLVEDMAAEQKARATYEHLMNMTDNAQILEPLYFLREREIVHYQRFGECLEIVRGILDGRPSSSCRCRNR